MSSVFVFEPNGKKKRWDCLVTIKETVCNVEADTKEEFISIVKETFHQDRNLILEDYEISEITGDSI